MAQWYGGHHLPGYSVLFPPLARWLGPRVVGALAVVAAPRCSSGSRTAAMASARGSARRGSPPAPRTTLFSGRLTFALGLVPALAALLALQRSTRASEARSAGSCDRLRSADAAREPGRGAVPRAGRNRLCAGERRAAACGRGRGDAPVAALRRVPGGRGRAVRVLVVLAGARVRRRRARARPARGADAADRLRAYALGCTAAFLLDTPIGGNVVRLGRSSPARCGARAVASTQDRAAAARAVPAVVAVERGRERRAHRERRPGVHAAYYAPLLAALDRAGAQGGATGRIEIPFTRLHWEARHVAPTSRSRAVGSASSTWRSTRSSTATTGAPPLRARYRPGSTATAVRWVAVPDVRLDYSAQDEARLIAAACRTCTRVARRALALYEVRHPSRSPPRRRASSHRHRLAHARRPPAGHRRLRVRWTPYWAVTQGDAASSPTATGRGCGSARPAPSAWPPASRSAGSARTPHVAGIAPS